MRRVTMEEEGSRRLMTGASQLPSGGHDVTAGLAAKWEWRESQNGIV
jgi:hypothetical protein